MFDVNIFSEKVEEEIRRLEKTAARLKGRERDAVLGLARTLRMEQRQLISASIEEIEWDQGKIIESLNDLESQVLNVENAISSQESPFVPTAGEAEEIVNTFFFSCQIVEEAMKKAYAKGTVTSKQMEDLNTQLRHLVRRMIRLSKRSETLLDAMLYALEAKIVA